MKRIAIILALLAALSGCSNINGRTSITGLLSAPKRSETESEIVNAINAYLGENIALEYSSAIGYSSPIQFMDLKGDETNEAAVFYYAPNKGKNIRFALLEYTDEGWNIVFDKEGLGGDVFYFDAVDFPGMEDKQIVVGYLPSNIEENFFVTYFTDTEVPQEDYVEVCKNITSFDIDDDGFREIVLTNSQGDGKTRIKAIKMSEENGYKVAGTKVIRRDNVEVTQIQFAKTAENETAFYIDYRDNTNKMYTEAFVFEGNTPVNCLCSEQISRLWPYENNLNSFDIDVDGVPEIPLVSSAQKPDETSGENINEFFTYQFVEWTDFSGQEAVCTKYGIYDTENNMFVALPDEWKGGIYAENTSAQWCIVSAKENIALVTIKESDPADSIHTEENIYTVRHGAKMWVLEFSENTDKAHMDYIIKNIAVFD